MELKNCGEEIAKEELARVERCVIAVACIDGGRGILLVGGYLSPHTSHRSLHEEHELFTGVFYHGRPYVKQYTGDRRVYPS